MPTITRLQRLVAFAVAFTTTVLLFGSIGSVADHYARAGVQDGGKRWAGTDRASGRTVASVRCADPT